MNAPDPAMSRLDIALAYAHRGWHVFPLQGKVPFKNTNGHLDAATDEARIRAWWTERPDANIGISAGPSMLFIVDIDGDTGRASWVELCDAYGLPQAPATYTVRTRRGGHFYFRLPADANVHSGKLDTTRYPGIDIKTTGGYVVAAGSTHPLTGTPYLVINSGDLDDAPGVLVHMQDTQSSEPVTRPLPPPANTAGRDWDDYADKVLTDELGKLAAMTAGEGRHDRIYWLARRCAELETAGRLWNPHAAKNAILDAAKACGEHTENPKLTERAIDDGWSKGTGTLREADRANSFPVTVLGPVDPDTPQTKRYVRADPLKLTDSGNAERLHRALDGIAAYVPALGGWQLWDGHHWRTDDVGRVYIIARDVMRHISDEVADSGDEELVEKYGKWAHGSESANRLTAAERLARPLLAEDGDDWDANHDLLNTPNGVLHIPSGELRDHDPDLRLTRCTAVPYDRDAPCHTWERFFADILPDPDVREYVHRAVGYSLTGHTREHILFMLWGIGSNGKSTFMDALSDVLGVYASTPAPSTFFGQAGQIPADLAALNGSRFISFSETGRSALQADTLKRFVAGDSVTARFMRQDFFTYKPVGKLWIATNDKPNVRGADEGIWRRIRLIPFRQQFGIDPTRPKDTSLPRKLADERSGILRWAVEGARRWYAEGFTNTPDAVSTATQEYRQESDPIGMFLDECCLPEPDTVTVSSDLYGKYRGWMEARGEKAVSQTRFSAHLRDHVEWIDKVENHGPTRLKAWRGVELRSSLMGGRV